MFLIALYFDILSQMRLGSAFGAFLDPVADKVLLSFLCNFKPFDLS